MQDQGGGGASYLKNNQSKHTNSNIQRLINRSNNDLLNNSNPVLNSAKQKSNQSINKSDPSLSAKKQKSNCSINKSNKSLQSNHYSSINTNLSSSHLTSNSKRTTKESSATVSKRDNKQKIDFGNLLDFSDYWAKQKSLYFTIQNLFLAFNFLVTLIILGFVLWINIDIRFQFVTDLGLSFY